jgi:hypothetical protein
MARWERSDGWAGAQRRADAGALGGVVGRDRRVALAFRRRLDVLTRAAGEPVADL